MITIKQRADAYVRKVLEGFPGEGSGLHPWLYSAAASISPFYDSEQDVEAAIHQAIAGSLSESRKRSIHREIRDAVRNGRAVAKAPDWYLEAKGEPVETAATPTIEDAGPRWPRKNYRRILQLITGRPYPLAEVKKHSPVPIKESRMTEDAIDALFPGNPLLWVAKATNKHHTAPRSEWRGRLPELPLMVPNAMSAVWGDKDTGGRSMRCNGNVGPRRYLVVEFDFATHDRNGKPTYDIELLDRLKAMDLTVADLCSTIICELQFGAPELRLVTASGGKSLHSWWDCQGLTDSAVEAFFKKACERGADPATWTRCQLVRIPDGTRENGARQQLHLLNPARS